LRHFMWLCAVMCVVANGAFADVIRVDQMPSNETVSGDFEIFRRDASMPTELVFEVLHLVSGNDWSSAGADGVGSDVSHHGDLSLARVVDWVRENNLPADELIISVDVSAPSDMPVTTAVIKRLSIRLGDSVFMTDDVLVIQSKKRQFGEIRLRLAPGFTLESRASRWVDSFRISAELAAPPGTEVMMYLSGEPRGVLESVAEGSMSSMPLGGGLTPPSGIRGGSAGGRGGSGGGSSPIGLPLVTRAPAPRAPIAPPPERGSGRLSNITPAMMLEEIAATPARDEEPEPASEDLDPIIPDPPPAPLTEIALDDPADDPVPEPEIDPVPIPVRPTNPQQPVDPGPTPQPTPEPASGLLLAFGALLVAKRSKRG